MPYPPTLTAHRPTWPGRFACALGVALSAFGAAVLGGRYMGFDSLVALGSAFAVIPAGEAVCFLCFGLLVFGRLLGWRASAWIALVPAGWSLFSSFESAFEASELTAPAWLIQLAEWTGRSAAITAGCLLLAALSLGWNAIRPAARGRIMTEVIIGSLVTAVAVSVIFGYAAGLRTVVGWGGAETVPALSAAGLLLLGIVQLLLVWRENALAGGMPPAWAPMPVVSGCLALTLTLWIGLRERERAFVDAKTQQAMESYVQAVGSTVGQQLIAFERISRNWSDAPENASAIWEADAAAQLLASGDAGCVSIAYVDPKLRTRWVFPHQPNVAAIDFDHSAVPARLAAIEAARRQSRPVMSATTDINGLRQAGFVIYCPIPRRDGPPAFVAAEYVYRTLFSSVAAAQLELSDDFHIEISIFGQPVFRGGAVAAKGNSFTLNKAFTLF